MTRFEDHSYCMRSWEGARAHIHVWPSGTGRLASCLWHQGEVTFCCQLKWCHFQCITLQWLEANAVILNPLGTGALSWQRSQRARWTNLSEPPTSIFWLYSFFGNLCQARESLLESYKTLTDKKMMGARFKVSNTSFQISTQCLLPG